MGERCGGSDYRCETAPFNLGKLEDVFPLPIRTFYGGEDFFLFHALDGLHGCGRKALLDRHLAAVVEEFPNWVILFFGVHGKMWIRR